MARRTGTSITVLRDVGHLVRARARVGAVTLELDLAQDDTPRLVPGGRLVEGLAVESFADLRASKLTCILSRSEPRDLVDLLFLDRAGHPPELELEAALIKDGGMDPGALAWLLGQFPTRPLPTMLQPLTEDELDAFRLDLRERLRRRALPG